MVILYISCILLTRCLAFEQRDAVSATKKGLSTTADVIKVGIVHIYMEKKKINIVESGGGGSNKIMRSLTDVFN